MSAYLFSAKAWHVVDGFRPSYRLMLACPSLDTIGFYVHLSGPYTLETILPALRCVADLQGFDAGTTGELCAECFPGRALAPVAKESSVSQSRAHIGHPSEMPCAACGRPTFGKRHAYQSAVGHPYCDVFCYERGGNHSAGPAGPLYVGDGAPNIKPRYDREATEPEQ